MEKIRKDALFASLPPVRRLAAFYDAGCPLQSKMVVLDDDPTGVQTVHNVNVYTQWDTKSLCAGLSEDKPVFFVLTNSRGLSAGQTQALHSELIENLCRASKETGVSFTLLSRSDSTLRGHYPLETLTLRNGLIQNGFGDPDGEIIAPFFPEGGRYTIGNVHYVQEGDWLTPAGMTEFAADPTFGYRSSNLVDWVREKNPSLPKDEPIHAISLETIRLGGPSAVERQLLEVSSYQKVIVNSADYADMEVFVAGLYRAMAKGKRFLFRSAAGLVRVMAAIPQAPLLTGRQLRSSVQTGGLVLVGSHVQKTTRQLEALLEKPGIVPLELDVRSLTDPNTAQTAIETARREIESVLLSGRTVAAYTTRQVVRITQERSEENLRFSLRVSDALVQIVKRLEVQPAFIVAKGGITSSDIGVKGLAVQRALVAGQILPGVPVWRLGPESKYPGACYVVFPGNVGDTDALAKAVTAASECDA